MQNHWTLVTDDGGCISSHGEHDTVEGVFADIDDMRKSGYAFTWNGPLRGTVFEPPSGATCVFSIEQGSAPETAQRVIELINADQASVWAGRELSHDELDRLDDCIPNSSIPETIATIVDSWTD